MMSDSAILAQPDSCCKYVGEAGVAIEASDLRGGQVERLPT